MSKVLALLVAVMMVAVALAACSSKPAANNDTPKADKPKAVLIVGQLGDRSFNDAAAEGLKKAQKDFGADVEAKYIESPEVAAVKENVIQFAKDGYKLIVVMGFTYVDMYKEVAPQYPNTTFMIIDATVEGIPNVLSVTFREHEGSFLVGALAALMSKTGNVGFIGGQDIPLIQRFEGGYIQGAKYINPNITVQSAYVGGWSDAAKGKELSLVQINKGADVVYAAAGGSGAGMIEAVKQENKMGIGVDSDQDYLDPEHMIGSMVKRVDNAVYFAIRDLKDGKLTGGTQVLGVKEDGVGYCGLEPVNDPISQKLVPADVRAKLEQIRQDIIAGKIQIADWMATGRPAGK
jgi:basic membrane protein A